MLRNPDPRQVAFTVLPGHGVVIVEKWVATLLRYQTIWGTWMPGIQIQNRIPRDPCTCSRADGRMRLEEPEEGADHT